MRINVATLCDFAQVRGNMLYVLSGGITRLYRTEFPGSMNMMLALMIETSAPEIAEVIEIRVSVVDGDGEVVKQSAAGIQMITNDSDLEKGEAVQAPIAVDLRAVMLPRGGRYTVDVSLPGFDVSTWLSFSARFAPQTPPLPGLGPPS